MMVTQSDPVRSKNRRWAVVFAIFALLLLVGAVVLASAAWGAARSAGRYRAAWLCDDGQSGDCRQQEWGDVMQVNPPRQRQAASVDVRLSDGRVLNLLDRGGDLGQRLEPGSPVMVEYWEGKPVLLREDGSSWMATQDNPDWLSDDNRFAAIMAAIAAPVFGLFAVIAARTGPKRGLRRSSRRPGKPPKRSA